jgi:hypothetical protein
MSTIDGGHQAGLRMSKKRRLRAVVGRRREDTDRGISALFRLWCGLGVNMRYLVVLSPITQVVPIFTALTLEL